MQAFVELHCRSTGLVANPRNKLVLLLQINNPALDMCERQQKLRHVSELCNDVPSPKVNSRAL